MAGRGFGKTLSAAEWVLERGREKKCRIAVIAPTLGDVRSICFEGETGLLAITKIEDLMGGTRSTAWNKSLFELTLANGTLIKGYSSEEPDRLRGPQHHFAWLEEASSFKDARLGDAMNTTWSNMTLGLRLGERPQAVITSTPKANKLTRHLVALPTVTVVKGSSYENRENLTEVWWRTIIEPLVGTRTGRQEIDAELLEDVEGALWTRSMIDSSRVTILPGTNVQAYPGWQSDPDLRDAVGARMRRIVVGLDPNTTSGESADAAGIVVAGQGEDNEGYVLDDRTVVKGGPSVWRAVAVDAYHDWSADKIIGEANNGGEMVDLVIKGFDKTVPVELVHASRGKRTRAEPVAALYVTDELHSKQATVHHVGTFPDLEDEQATWTPADESPNRMDAAVWALTKLRIWQPPASAGISVPQGDIPGLVELGSGLLDPI
jgi:phage terminase large subunit-like protein